MKNQITIAAVLLISLFILFSLSGMAQEEKKEKLVTIKTVKVEDGNKVVTDTTFTVKDGEEVKKYVEDIYWVTDGDSIKVKADIFIDEEHCKEGKKMIIIKKDGDKETVEEFFVPSEHKEAKKIMKFKTDNGEEVIMVSPRHHKKMVWNSDEDAEYEFDVDYDIEVGMQELEAEMEAHMHEMENVRVIVIDEKMELLDELGELEDIEIEMIRRPRPPKHIDISRQHMERFDHGVSDKELRDAGIKNKPDRLEVEELDIDNNGGVITLNFTIPGEASPKVEAYNFFGDKVFSGKPEIVSGKYNLVMDLSQKQHGKYYLQIINKNSSFTEKIRL